MLTYRDGYEDDGDDKESGAGPLRMAGDAEPESLRESYFDDDDDDGYSQSVTAMSHAAAYGDEADEWSMENLPPYQALAATDAAPAPEMTIETKRDLIGKLGRYDATECDAGFEGDYGTGHPAYQRYHLGLSYGVVLFNQDAGTLGRLVVMMRDRDPATFGDIFGEYSDRLLQLTNAPGPQSKDAPEGRSARVQPLGGADLWQEPWLTRFRQAADQIPFRAAQNQLAAMLFLDPMLPFARFLGLRNERSLAILMTLAAALGVEEAQQWVAGTVSPVQTTAQRQQALTALKLRDVAEFQQRTPGLKATGQWDSLTQAAAIAALREVGAGSPLPVPSAGQMVASLVRRSAGTPHQVRIERINDATQFSDGPLQF